MMMIDTVTVLSLLQSHPLQLEYDYGTAGFRYAATVMAPVMVRVGLVSRLLLGEQNMGVMITASHNDESYNGVKISNPDGSMIGPAQEALLIQWVNETDMQKWQHKLDELESTTLGSLHVGRDTRSHSPSLSALLVQAAQAMGVTVVDHGIVTTPMLHHIVLYSNVVDSKLASRQAYLEQLAQAYVALNDLLLIDSDFVLPPLQVDGACGVGYPAMADLQALLAAEYGKRFQARNPPGTGPLNEHCGSEHVQKQLQPPTWYDGENNDTQYCCSLDGDADRIVFFSCKNNSLALLLDGDKIAVLIAHFLQTLQQRGDLPSSLTLGFVQTAYANGASTAYLKDTLKLPVVITKTGVKHLHHAALEFDIGIYFEANGHGTVLFSPRYHEVVQANGSAILAWLPKLINPAVGDALSDLLLVDLLLRFLKWTLNDWATKLYTDLPSRQLKVQVQDRSLIVCNDNETQALQPPALQPALNEAMTSLGGRAFVRPSGTENVVRIYAEAATRPLADQLATRAAQIVHETCQGVGPLPKI